MILATAAMKWVRPSFQASLFFVNCAILPNCLSSSALIALLTVFEDADLDGLHSAIRSPHVIACAIFIVLYAQLKQFVRLVYEIVLPWNRQREMRYKAIEDKIFMEEYENPEQ